MSYFRVQWTHNTPNGMYQYFLKVSLLCVLCVLSSAVPVCCVSLQLLNHHGTTIRTIAILILGMTIRVFSIMEMIPNITDCPQKVNLVTFVYLRSLLQRVFSCVEWVDGFKTNLSSWESILGDPWIVCSILWCPWNSLVSLFVDTMVFKCKLLKDFSSFLLMFFLEFLMNWTCCLSLHAVNYISSLVSGFSFIYATFRIACWLTSI